MTAPAQAHRMTEAELKRIVVKMARDKGWKVFHQSMSKPTRPVRTQGTSDAVGFPDLVLARRGIVLFMELKAHDGKTSLEQVEWAMELPDYELIRPSDLARGRVDELLY